MKVNNFAVKLSKILRQIDNKLWSDCFYVISDMMAQKLSKNNLIVADVGAAYGTDLRWHPVESYTHFITFEPDIRSQNYENTIKTTNFATGLSDKQGTKLLHLTKFPPASSLYQLNLKQLDDYANREWHEVVDSISIELDTLDNCLSHQSHLFPDFLKIDVEGADLDVLKGATKCLETSITGLQIEVSFIERHQGAPFFGEIDNFLRRQGFALFILSREHWVRQNLVYGANSHPQIIWGDAVYFINQDKFLERLQSACPEEKIQLLTKFIVILLSYGVHDYAMQILDAVDEANLVSESVSQDLKQSVESSLINPKFYLIKCILGFVFAGFIYILSLPLTYFRQRTAYYLKKSSAKLFYHLYMNSNRGGIYNSCISDSL